jgi:hypothetical protein
MYSLPRRITGKMGKAMISRGGVGGVVWYKGERGGHQGRARLFLCWP